MKWLWTYVTGSAYRNHPSILRRVRGVMVNQFLVLGFAFAVGALIAILMKHH